MIKKIVKKIEANLEKQGNKSGAADSKPFAGVPKAPKAPKK